MTVRAFIALDLSESCIEALAGLQRELKAADAKAPVSWVKVRQVHLTLTFLGDVKPELIPDIAAALDAVAARTAPFDLRPAGCGAFPSLRRMRVLWAGLEGEGPGAMDALRKLQREVESAMTAFGFEREDRPFKPHLTLGRVKGQGEFPLLRKAALDHTGFRAEPFGIAEIVLYKSDLRPGGSVYTTLHRAPLTGSPDNREPDGERPVQLKMDH